MRNWKYINGAEGVKIGNEKISYRGVEIDLYGTGNGMYTYKYEIKQNKGEKNVPLGGQGRATLDLIKKQIDEDLAASKVGNDTLAEYAKRPPKIVGGNSLPEELEKDVEKKDKEKVEEVEELKKTGNANLKPGDKIISFGKSGTVKGVYDEYADTIYGEPLIEVEFEDGTTKKIGEHYMRKVGNAGFDLRDPDPDGRLEAKARADAQKRLREEEEKKKRIDGIYKDKDGNKWRVHYRFGPGVRYNTQYLIDRFDYSDIGKLMERLPNGFVKIGNSASDDKFAYVMREFEEGKLKTPDGKVVTDPAQAKAIAYSESKKTENGLARARNAMVKNIATYKDFTRDLDKAIMLEVAGINYNNVDEQTLKQWVEQAKKDGYASAIKGLQGKKLILDVY